MVWTGQALNAMGDTGNLPTRDDIKRTIKHLKYTKINEQLSKAMVGLNESTTPIETLFNNLRVLLYGVAREVEAQQALLLRPSAETPQDPSQLVVDAVFPQQRPDLLETIYTLSADDWAALNDHRGFRIYSAASARRLRRTLFKETLLDDDASIETAIIGVGDYDQPAKFVLIFSHQISDAERDKRYRDEFQDLFALLTLWLHQIYNMALNRLRERQYDEDRSQFIQDVMHQLTGSLSAISASVERMLSGRERDFDAALKRLYQRAHMFQSYTQTFSLAASTEKRSIVDVYGEEFEEFSAEDWVQLIQRNCDFFLDKASAYHIDGPRIVPEHFEMLPKTRVKRQLMELVVFNLVDNAVKYSQPHASVPILVEARISPDGNNLMLDFVNHGIVVTQDDTQSIFERYQRSFGARESEPNGTGVGLYLCRQIMQLHGGDIEVQPSRPSALYPGAHQVRFTMRLPTLDEVRVSAGAGELDERPTLLIIEDEVWLHENLILTLRESFQVEVAQNSEQALNFLSKPRQRQRVKAILLDIQLTHPSSNAPSGREAGVELARLLTQDYAYDIPIIGITAYNSAQIHRAMLDAGAQKVLRRSISLDELLETVREYMQP